ncbi:MAG: SRPBCC family protein [Opitutales bacterium]
MKLVEKKEIKATPEMVWEIIHDPGNMPAWNHKCVFSESPPEIKEGAVFQVSYQMSREKTDMRGEIVQYKPNALIRFRYSGEVNGKPSEAEEILEIEPIGTNAVLVSNTVDISKSGLPRWVQVLAWLLSRFGRKAGDGPLDHIEGLIPDY